MAEGGCIGEFPHNVIRDELLPLRVVVDKCLDVLLQERARDCHLSFLVHLLFGVKSETDFIEVCANSVSKTGYQAGKTVASPDQSYLWGLRRFGVIVVIRPLRSLTLNEC